MEVEENITVSTKKNHTGLIIIIAILSSLVIGLSLLILNFVSQGGSTNTTDNEVSSCPECDILDGVSQAEQIRGGTGYNACAPNDGIDLIVFIRNQDLYAKLNSEVYLIHKDVKELVHVSLGSACNLGDKIAFVTIDNQLRIVDVAETLPFDQSTVLREGVTYIISYEQKLADRIGVLRVALDTNGDWAETDIILDIEPGN